MIRHIIRRIAGHKSSIDPSTTHIETTDKPTKHKVVVTDRNEQDTHSNVPDIRYTRIPMPKYSEAQTPRTEEDVGREILTEEKESREIINVRKELREILISRFNLRELRDLCFDLGINHEFFDHHNIGDFSRELVNYYDRRNQIGNLVAQIKETRKDIDITRLTPFIGLSKPRTKIQIIIDDEAIEKHTMEEIIERLAGEFRIPRDEISIMGAAWGTIRLLLSVPEANYDVNIKGIKIIEYEDLPDEDKHVWREIFSNHPSAYTEEELMEFDFPVWRDVELELEKEGRRKLITVFIYILVVIILLLTLYFGSIAGSNL
jgi:hypothetical protein